jgi:hypothetical protein
MFHLTIFRQVQLRQVPNVVLRYRVIAMQIVVALHSLETVYARIKMLMGTA